MTHEDHLRAGEDRLRDGFRRLARAVPQTAGPASEECVRAAFRSRRDAKARRWKHVMKAAASVVVAAGLYLIWADWTHRRSPEERTSATEFIALPYAQSEVPLEQPVIVRVQIPVSELGGMGVPFVPAAARESVSADLLVGQDGVARAVRVVE
jgi:hypothetical protein